MDGLPACSGCCLSLSGPADSRLFGGVAMANEFLLGKKIALRAFRREDLPDLSRWWDNSDVTHYLEMGARPTRPKYAEAFLRLAEEVEDAIVFAIVEKATGRAVGTCGLYLINWICRRAQFNILIGEPEVWDKGYGSEAARMRTAERRGGQEWDNTGRSGRSPDN